MPLLQQRDPWDQLIEEPDICYSMFRGWLLAPPASRPAPSDPALASMFRWSERALAYDQQSEIPADPKERVAYAFEKSTRLACIGVQKLLRVELGSPDLQIDPRLLVRLLHVSVSLPAAAAGLQPAESAWTLPDDTPQEDVDRLIKMLAGAVKDA